jgi:hypothetical protein
MSLRARLIFTALLAAGPAFGADGTATEDARPPLELWQEDRTQIFEAADIDLAAFQWVARPLVVFADTPADPRFAEQVELLTARISELEGRDVVLITDTDPAAKSAVRQKLRPRGFMLALIGKDGGVKLRKPFPWSVRELSRSIDKMPLRQEEIRARAQTE